MKNFKVKSLIYFLLFILLFQNCKQNSNENKTTIVIDSLHNINLMIPDTLDNLNVENIKHLISESFINSERFYLDTISNLSPISISLNAKAFKLRNELIKVLPKISITTGIEENKFTRDYYIIEGDIKLDRDELLDYCKKRLQVNERTIQDKYENSKFTIATDLSGNPSIWPIGTVIKYSIMRSSFSSKSAYDSAVLNMKQATKDWMKVCNIKFLYLSNLDNSNIDIESFNEPVFFIVRQINSNNAFIAQAFFPNDPVYERMLLIDNSFYSSPYSKVGVLRHELGHILGFRHEHIWSKESACAGESIIEGELSAKPITNYDPYSVMHYPCGINKNNKLLNLTEFDITGAAKVYPF